MEGDNQMNNININELLCKISSWSINTLYPQILIIGQESHHLTSLLLSEFGDNVTLNFSQKIIECSVKKYDIILIDTFFLILI